MNRRKRVF